MKPNKNCLDTACEILCLVMLLGTAVFLAFAWEKIPAEVPMHYNAAGEIDRWGKKWELLILPLISGGLYLMITVIGRHPEVWNTGGIGTEKMREQGYTLLGHLLSTLKVLVVGIFTGMTACIALVRALPSWFLPVVLVALFLDMGYWIFRVYQVR